MEVRRPKQIAIACRFIPYDQWFLTHIDPTWKIRHLKQIILAKCLSLPFDPRKVAREAAGVRPPSPITFAPDESQRPASPIKFASVLEVRKKRSAGGGGGGGGVGQGLGEDGVEGGFAGAGGGAGSSGGTGAGAGAAAVTSTAAAAASTSVHDAQAHAHAHAARAEEDGPGPHEDAAPGEEGYEEDDEWDEEDDSDDHELGGGSSSRPMGGRVGAGGFGGRVELPGPPVPPLGSLAIPAPQPQPASAVSSPVVKTARKFNPLAKLSAAATTSTSNAAASTSPSGITAPAVSQHQQQDDAPQIHTTSFTLVRFSTGQVLEEEFLVSWYDLVPHELVELHASSPIPGHATSTTSTTSTSTTNLLVGFAGAVHLAKALMGPLPPPSSHDPKEKKGGQHQHHHQLRIPTHLTLTALPRHDLALYVQPYWEGWVRALRVVWRSEMPLPLPGAGAGAGAARGGVMAASAGGFDAGAGARGVGAAAGVSGGSSIPGPGASRSHTHPQPYDFSDYALGMTNLSSSMGGGMGMWVPDPQVPLFGGAGAGGYGAHGGRDDGYGGRVKTKLEWRERWVVIRDGVINLCKTREDPTPTHRLPLSSLLSLRDASHLANSVRSKSSYRSGPSSVSSRARSKTSSHRPSERERDREHRRSTSAPRSSTSTAKDPRRQPREDEVGVSTMPPVPRSSRARGGTDVDDDRYLRPPGLASTPASGSGLTEAERRAREVERERQRERQREREKEREREREKERQRRRRREQEEKELEYLRRWDDIGISFGKKKDKEKEKGKGKEKEGERTRDKGKEKERERGASSRHDKERERRDREKEKERKQGQSQGKPPREEADANEREREMERQKEKERERERERERDRQRQRESERERERDKEKARQNERTYIPSSREEAEAAGMKIVCAKFKSTRPWERDELELKEKADREKVLKYTSTGPSLAGEPAPPPPPVVNDLDPHSLRSVGSEESGLNLHRGQPVNPPPRKASLPALVGLGKLGSAPSISMSSPATSSVAIHSGATAATASSSTMVSASTPKFMGGLFGKSSGGGGASDRDGPVDKEERKREEKERKAREKETKALEKEREKEKKAQDKAKKRDETGDEEDYGVGSGLSWKLGKRRVGVRRDDRERERVQRVRGASLDVQSPSAVASAPSGSTMLQERSIRQFHQHQEDGQSNFRSTSNLTSETASTLNDDDGTSSMNAQSLLISDDRSIAPSSIGRPKLTLSPIMDATPADEQDPISAVAPNEALPLPPGLTQTQDEPQSDSNSSSLSLSSPVFAHSTDSGESGDEFDNEGRGLLQGGGKPRSRRAERGGYRYGGYQHHPRRTGGELVREKEKEREEGGKGSATDEKTESGKGRAQASARKEEEGRGHESETRRKSDREEVGAGSGRERGVYGQSNQHPPRQQQPSQHRRDEREKERKRREDERGEWIVLDMGNDHAFNSILRIFHRYFSRPLTSTFVPSSITGLPTPSSMVTTHSQSQSYIQSQPESRSTSHSNLPTQPSSPTSAYPNSPIQSTFWSSTTLPVSSSNSLATNSISKAPATTPGSDADDEDYGSSLANSSLQASRIQDVKPTHPSVLSLDTPKPKPIKNPSLSLSLSLPLAPALPYPEWRTEIVQRARRHGMREAGRPLDLAQNGWRSEFEWVEEKRRERMVLRVDARQIGWGVGGVDEDEDEVEAGAGADGKGEEVSGEGWSASGLEEQRRMSQVSHVSTINAVRMNAAAGARSFNETGELTPSLPSTPLDAMEEWVDARESPSSDDHDGADADSAGGYADDDYDPEPGYGYSYAYGHEDEEDALAQGMESLLEDGDSDEGERSETEWVAWLTDLPRQVEVRKQQAFEAERKKEVERENARAKKRVKEERVDVMREQSSAGGPQLSPMVFGNPFAEQQAQAQAETQAEIQPRTSLSASLEPNVVIMEHTSTSTTPSRGAGAHQPATQEEERQLVVDSRRRFEPSARSYPQPPPALPPATSMLHSSSADLLPFGSRESLQLHRQHSHLMGVDSATSRASIASTQPSSFTYTPAQVHVLSETRVRVSSTGSSIPPRMRDRHRDRDVHRTPSRNTLSSPSSSDSLAVVPPTRGGGSRGGSGGSGAAVSPIDVNLPSNSTRRGDNPISPVDSDGYGYASGTQYADAPSSSTTPPSATAHSNSHPRIVQAHRRTHSRSTSGSLPGIDTIEPPISTSLPPTSRMSRLYHSTSMPLAAAASAVAPLGPAGSGSGSVPSSPPRSPMPVGTGTPMHVPRSSLVSVSAATSSSTSSANAPSITSASTSTSTSTSTTTKTSAPPVAMSILTQAQIHQIESETEMMLRSGKSSLGSGSQVPMPTSSPHHPPTSFIPMPVPRRSSSAGMSIASTSGSPPSSGAMAVAAAASVGGGGSLGRSSSVISKVSVGVGSGGAGGSGGERHERGVLRKRLSDLGKHVSGGGGNEGKERERDGESSPPSKLVKPRPKLSLPGLGSGSSSTQASQHQHAVEIHSPTYHRQGMRSPTTSTASSHPYTAASASGSGSVGGSANVNSNASGSGGMNASTMASAKALLRRVRSGSSLRMDMHPEERESLMKTPPVPLSPTNAITTMTSAAAMSDREREREKEKERGREGSRGREMSPGPPTGKKTVKKGAMERIVRGLDSALEFVEGK